MDKLDLPESEWRDRLTPEQFHVLREAGTERAFSRALTNVSEEGRYLCAGCQTELSTSDTKCKSGSGWPSFTEPASDDAVSEHSDVSHGMRRVEVRCARCDGHLGHVFPDGPGPNGLRYCMNSVSLKFEPKS